MSTAPANTANENNLISLEITSSASLTAYIKMVELRKNLNVRQRVSLIMGDIGAIKRGGRNTDQNYQYIEYDAIVGTLRSRLSDYGVLVTAHPTEIDTQDITAKSGRSGLRINLKMTFRVENADDPKDYFEIQGWPGQADSYDDKTINKAITSAIKYFLMKLFLISDRNDSDADTGETTTSVKGKAPLPFPKNQGQQQDPPPPAAPTANNNTSNSTTNKSKIQRTQEAAQQFDDAKITEIRTVDLTVGEFQDWIKKLGMSTDDLKAVLGATGAERYKREKESGNPTPWRTILQQFVKNCRSKNPQSFNWDWNASKNMPVQVTEFEQAVVEGAVVENSTEEEPNPDPNGITPKQRNYIFAVAKENEVSVEQIKKICKDEFGKDSLNALTKEEASKLVDLIKIPF